MASLFVRHTTLQSSRRAIYAARLTCFAHVHGYSSTAVPNRIPTKSIEPAIADAPPVVIPAPGQPGSPIISGKPPPAPVAQRPRPTIRATKAALNLTPTAVDRLKSLLLGPTPQFIRIGVRNKGCAGMSYHLEYVDKPAKFDEVVEQDGVKVLIDSKALFSIIGSEMDWVTDRLSSKFSFKNPNIKDACGCGESFTV